MRIETNDLSSVLSNLPNTFFLTSKETNEACFAFSGVCGPGKDSLTLIEFMFPPTTFLTWTIIHLFKELGISDKIWFGPKTYKWLDTSTAIKTCEFSWQLKE